MKNSLLLILVLFSSSIFGYQERYDPDKLPPHEIACGNLKAKNSAPCSCMKHRTEVAEKRRLICEEIPEKKMRRECMAEAEVCHIIPTDQDTWLEDGQDHMPPQCKRSCSKARCECCHT